MKFLYFVLFAVALIGCRTSSSSGLAAAPTDDRFAALSAGIYWYGASAEQWSFFEDKSSPYYDPAKKTLIIVRGWGKGEVEEERNETINYKDMGGPDLSVTDAWIKQGWNVGFVNWNQYSDEKELKDAESKIWSSTARQGMRWVDGNLTWHPAKTEKNVTQIIADNLEVALADFHGSELRFVGHSLGGQLAVAIAAEMDARAQKNPNKRKFVPSRLALIEPVFTKGDKDYLGNKTSSEYSTAIVQRLISKYNFAVETFACSGLVLGALPILDQTHEIWREGLYTQRMLPSNIGKYNFGGAHAACFWQYLLSIQGPVPQVQGLPNIVAGSAKQSIDIISSMRRGKKWLKQVSGPNYPDIPVYQVQSW